MRREIGVASVSGGVDQVQLLELLGEGTYGKVYKGKQSNPCPCRCQNTWSGLAAGWQQQPDAAQ